MSSLYLVFCSNVYLKGIITLLHLLTLQVFLCLLLVAEYTVAV